MNIGTPFTKTATKVMLLGSGELGKEVAIELTRLGIEVHACDSYPNAPAMQVAQHAHVFDMLDANKLRVYIRTIKPDYVVPEVEAIATDVLQDAEESGVKVIPNAQAVRLTMNREGIRKLAAEQLGLKTSKYKFASTEEEFNKAVKEIGLPCFVKPIMSSSGKGQSLISSFPKIGSAWKKAQSEGRAGSGKVIVEECIDFDYEITLLTIRHKDGTSFCDPIGHRQVDGDYIESWQPQPMSGLAMIKAKDIATKVTEGLGGYGVFGVELFVKGDEVYFSEVSPRPHDTGLVTLISQDLSEFALHTRALLGLPVTNIVNHGPSASHVIKPEGKSNQVQFSNLENALDIDNTQIRLFGKPGINGKRRMGVALERRDTIESAKLFAKQAADNVNITLE